MTEGFAVRTHSVVLEEIDVQIGECTRSTYYSVKCEIWRCAVVHWYDNLELHVTG